MTEQFLDSPDVVPLLEQMGREGVTKRVTGSWLRQLRPPGGFLDGRLPDRLVQVTAAILLKKAKALCGTRVRTGL